MSSQSPIWISQPTKVLIRSSAAPCTGYDLAGVAVFYDKEKEETSVFNIAFSLPTVEAVGMRMPYGISPDHTACIRVTKEEDYHVECCYLGSNRSILLWRQSKKPTWMRALRPV